MPAVVVLSAIALPLSPVSRPAFAHAHLQAATLADKATIKAAPEAITLRFSEGLSLALSGATLSGEDQSEIGLGEARLSDDGKSLILPLAAALKPGTYRLDWHVLSVDGHKTKGTTSFTVAP
ncbi:hypothetical protein BJF93_08955 [Xaviernesmea oryzae]|uniref:CopC domain-containing protein n=1 Tax=Xaviernesmea oryzae TaxID=464029 RepID=A0A1Q9B179_9HYPH|nr:hypothetical protein BJF93_08955 [Xaviernesmea oryzae]